MERSVEETAVEAESAPPSTPEARRPRRFVQSKLSWHGPPVEAACTAAEGEREEMGDSDAESEGKRKRRRKSQPRAPRKTPVTSKEEHGPKSDSDFARKGLGRSPRRKQKKEPQDAVPLKAGKSKNCKVLDSMDSNKNCRRPKNKKNCETTPEKATTSCDSVPKVVDSQQRRSHNKSDGTKNLDGQNLHVNQPVVDLRLEAKIAAEENIRLSAGKQTHPFFSSWKASKRVPDAQDTMKVENRHLISCPPIHVFDTLGDDVVSLDWRNWVFKERTPLDLDGYHTLETNLSVFESSVEPLKLDTVSCEGMHLNPYSDEVKRNSSASATTSNVLPNGQDSKKLFSHTELVHSSCNDSFSSRCPSFVNNEQQDNLFKERLSPYYRRCIYSPQCSLWTNKYQPENALEVCGNRESITFLSEWLKSWRERGLDTSKNFKYGGKYPIEDGEDSSYKNEYDTDEMDDDATLKNVLLITGPIGSGKSAAIYACAKEQGYEVIEVNASDLRNGSHVKQKYGEALESHGFNRWSSDDPIGSRRKNILDLLSSPPDIEEGKEIEDGPVEITSRTFNQDTTPAECSLDDETASYQVTNKTLILFEDVDTVFDEDRGFISTILKLAETSKRPIILTSNNKNPILPQVLDRSVLDFTLPSFGELLPHVYMVCTSENICIPSHLLEQLIRLCLGDIRKTLMLLQFWCQGKRGTDRNMHFTYSPLPCDVDAAHLVMPRIIPWEFECELSKRVEEEISKTISAVEENLRFLEAVKQQELDSTESIDFSNHRDDVAKPIKTRKKRRLKRRDHSFPDPTEESAHANVLEDFSDALDSPFKCARRTDKHRHGTVLTFQSDDQSDNDKLLLTNIIPDVSTEPLLQMQESPNDSEIPVYPLYQLRDDIVRNPFENCEIASTSHICDTFKLHDVSCVPESSFVSVTETKRDGCLSTVVSSNNMSVSFADFIKSIHVPPGAEANNLDRAIIESSKFLSKNVGNTVELDAESVHGNEEQGDFQNEESEAPANVCHLMDECSRADMLVPGKNSNCSLEVGSVPETWRNLRSRHEDLKQYLTTNQKDAALIVKFASGLTDLISETDIMFSTCTPLVSDVLEPSRTPSVEPDAFSSYWERLEIGSSYAQHGLRFYTNKCAIIGSNLGFESTLNLAQEMLASSSNTMALGKLLTQGHSPCQNSYVEGCLHTKAPRCGMSIGRELESELYNVILPVVPRRLSMTLRGSAFHDYLSFMSQISKLECSRLSESINKNHQRRSRASKHYLSSCSLPLSPEDVELLAQSNCFKD